MKSKSKVDVIVVRHTRYALTPREKQVLKVYAKGHTYQEIADKFGISGKTVGSYMQRIREKLRVKNRADLVARAVDLVGLQTSGRG